MYTNIREMLIGWHFDKCIHKVYTKQSKAGQCLSRNNETNHKKEHDEQSKAKIFSKKYY